MSKTIKTMIMREYRERISAGAATLPGEAMVISLRALKGTQTTKARATLRKKKIRVTVLRNSLARKTFEGTPLEPLGKLLSGSSALAFGGSVVEMAREIVSLAKEMPAIELRGAILDGTVFEGKAGVEALSKYPTRSEAISQTVTLILSPARNLAAQILGPGSTVAGLVKAIETKLEKGEATAAAGAAAG